MSTAAAVVAVLAAGAAGHLAAGPALVRAGPSTVPPRPEAAPAADVAVLTRLRAPLSLLAGAGGWAFFGGTVGLVLGAAALVGAWVVLGRAESPSTRRRREQLVRDLPVGVDLVGACLAAGAAVDTALATVAAAFPGPLGDELGALHHRLRLGADPAVVWAALAEHPQLGPLGRAIGRAHESGASVSSAVRRLAEELRARGRAEVEERARGVDVKAAAPLGVCFLPAFLLLGVVPLVVGVFGSMQVFG